MLSVPTVLFTVRTSVRPKPRPDEGTDRSTGVLSSPTRQAKTDGRAIINLEREEADDNRNISLLV
ncbi:hypothetical protein YC2023_050880 [Brassica napus]